MSADVDGTLYDYFDGKLHLQNKQVSHLIRSTVNINKAANNFKFILNCYANILEYVNYSQQHFSL